VNSLMPVRAKPWTSEPWTSEPWTAEPVDSLHANTARTILPQRVLTSMPLPSRPALPPRRAVPVTRNSGAIRAFDIIVAGTALTLLLPVLLLVALAIKLLDPGPLLFAHVRVGQGGRGFRCLKFRSMTVDADVRLARLLESDPAARAEWAETQKLRDDPRITPVGPLLTSQLP